MRSASASASVASGADLDWRTTVSQATRNGQVREVAKVLASLEPGATSASKLMLAMRFEDSIFQQASSLADYQKRITKRLKKVQKSYKPPPAPGAGDASSSSAAATAAEEAARREKELEIERNLRRQYGDDLRFIVKNAPAAVRAMADKHGKSRSDHLRQHTDNAEQWAVEIGMDDLCPHRKRRSPREAGYLDRLKQHLQQRVDNIRSHVVKLTHPDLFLEETLVKLEDELDEKALDILAVATKAIIEKHRKEGQVVPPPVGPTDAAGMRALLEKVTATIPPPRNAAAIRDANLARVEKIRAASHSLSAYLCLDAHTKAEVKKCLSTSHKIAAEEVATLLTEMAGFGEEDSRKEGEVLLEHAWNRPLEYTSEPAAGDDADPSSIEGGGEQGPVKKKARRSDSKTPPASDNVVIRSKVLLTKSRKPPSNLVLALKQKRAKMITPSSSGALCGAGTQLRIQFGTTFEMIVYFVPLLVSIRALPMKSDTSTSTAEPKQQLEGSGDVSSEFRRTIVDGGLPAWVSSTRGLVGRTSPVSVLGATGPASSLGPIVASKLDYASACATRALRRCFADVARKAYENPNASDFEVEIVESTALLRFVQLARSTYTPSFQDDDP
mmetsp:Transcript_31729/g.93071  ORF Transcript_31729/g.93071 Transcript_31729/m.93071 type:complete len:614 (+) Transcript_31729:334-2175(+)